MHACSLWRGIQIMHHYWGSYLSDDYSNIQVNISNSLMHRLDRISEDALWNLAPRC